MAKIKVEQADNSVLWHIVFAPFVDQRSKEVARAELRKRGQYGEPIIGIEEEDDQ